VVDDENRVQLILYGTAGMAPPTPGIPFLGPLADYLQQAGIGAIDADAALILSANPTGTTVNLAGGKQSAANVVISTTDSSRAPAMTVFQGSQRPVFELIGQSGGQAVANIAGHYAAADTDGNQTWRVPDMDAP
jgi:hypothetical protein